MELKNVPYLVSISSLPIEALIGGERYTDSLRTVTSEYEHVVISYQPVQYLMNVFSDYKRFYKINTPYPGNLHRFDPLAELFSTGEMNPDRWVIFTDTFDVKFQTDFPDFSKFEDREILVADEGETWGESTWFPTLQAVIKKVNFIEDMKDKPILNAGTWAMKGHMFMEMYEYMLKRSKMYDDHPWSDQSMYNEFAYNGKNKITNHPTFITVLYKNVELGNTIISDNYFMNRNNELYSIVHGNGSSKELFNDE